MKTENDNIEHDLYVKKNMGFANFCKWVDQNHITRDRDIESEIVVII